MPLYMFENLESGARFEEFRRIEDRDEVPEGCKRVFVHAPSPVGFAADPDDDVSRTRKYFAKRESELGSVAFEKKMGFSRRQLDYIWRPENAPMYEPELVGGG